MKTIFYIDYIWDYYNETKPVKIYEGIIDKFKTITWNYEGKNSKILNKDPDFTQYTFVSQNYIIVLYDESIEYSKTFHHPNNLVIYNLKKEIIRIIKPPKPIIYKYKDLPFTQFYGIEIVDSVKHLAVFVGEWNDEEVTHSEIRYLNLVTFEFHPTYYDIWDSFGRNKPTKLEKFGR
jgi:hypothetical protein